MNAGQLLINELRTGIDTIDLIITKDLEKKESRQLQGAHWNDDPVLITNLANLVNSVKVIAQSAVKMSMLKTSIFSFDIMDSFCKENIPIVNNIVTSYM